MADLGKAYVQIIPSAKGISGKIQQELGGAQVGERAGARIGKGLIGKLGGIVAAAGIGTLIVKGISASIKEGAALEQSLGGVETLFKENADTVIKNAHQAYKTAGMSANEYMENVTSFSAALIKSLGGDTKAAAKASDMALRDMSDNANKFGTDMGSITDAYQGFAKQNYTMLDNLKLGYGGTKTEMQRLLSDAEKFSGVHYDINNLDDVYNAIHVIQEEMGVTGTTAEEASKTLSGSFGMMKSAWTDLLGALSTGEDLSEPMAHLAESAATFLFDNLLPAIGKVIVGIPTALVEFFKNGGATDFAESAKEFLKNFGQALVDNAPIVYEKLTQALSDALTKLVEWDPTETDEAGKSLMDKIAQGLVDNAPTIAKAVGQVAGKVMLLFILGIPKLGIKLSTLLFQMTGTVFNKVRVAVMTKLTALFKNVLSKIGAKIGEIKTNIVNKVKGIPTAIGTALSNLWQKFTEPFTTAKQKISDIIQKIKDFFPFDIGKILKLKIPKISVSGGKAPWGIGGKGKTPSFDVKWNAKGAIYDGASIIGVGEAGREAVVPLQSSYMRPFAKAIADEMPSGGGDIVINLNYEAGADVNDMLRDLARGIQRYRRAGAF